MLCSVLRYVEVTYRSSRYVVVVYDRKCLNSFNASSMMMFVLHEPCTSTCIKGLVNKNYSVFFGIHIIP